MTPGSAQRGSNHCCHLRPACLGPADLASPLQVRMIEAPCFARLMVYRFVFLPPERCRRGRLALSGISDPIPRHALGGRETPPRRPRGRVPRVRLRPGRACGDIRVPGVRGGG